MHVLLGICIITYCIILAWTQVFTLVEKNKMSQPYSVVFFTSVLSTADEETHNCKMTLVVVEVSFWNRNV